MVASILTAAVTRLPRRCLDQEPLPRLCNARIESELMRAVWISTASDSAIPGFARVELTWDNAHASNRLHDPAMPELLAKANEAILEAQYLRREGRLLRFEASVLASQLGQTVVQSRRAEKESSALKDSLDQALSKP